MNDTACPKLSGPGISLEPLVGAHAETLFGLLNDEDVSRYDDGPVCSTIAELEDRFRFLEKRQSPDGTMLWLNWAIAVPDQGLAGYVQATVAPDRRSADVAYVLGKRFWSRGHASAAVRLMLAHLASALSVETAHATIDERNEASIRLARRLGFELADASDSRNLRFSLTLSSPAERRN